MQRVRNAVKKFRETAEGVLEPVGSGLLSLANAVGDFFRGAWQQVSGPPDAEDVQEGLAVAVVYDCVRRIATDIAKMSPGIRRLTTAGVWMRDKHQTLSRLLSRPNHFQTWFQFMVSWVTCRLIAGNVYVLKLYRGLTVEELIVLDPTKVTCLVARDTGNIFYRVAAEPLARVPEDMIVSAADLIHDRYLPLGNPMIGSSPLERSLVASRARSSILENSADLNEHSSVPPGLIIAPEGQTEEQLNQLADRWRKLPKGRVAVLDAAYKFESLAAKYVDSQSTEIAELSAVDVCVAFSMPPWKLGFGVRPTGEPEALQIIYLQDCLQWQVEEIEQCLDRGLDVPTDVYVELDPHCLLKMDSKTRAAVAAILVKGIAKPNELREWWDWAPVAGGDAVYSQQQNFSLEALAKRDALGPPPSAGSPSPAPSEPADPEDPEAEERNTGAAAHQLLPSWHGVYDASREYPKDAMVTLKRGLWLAKAATPAGAKPTENPGLWQLVAGYGEPIPGTQE